MGKLKKNLLYFDKILISEMYIWGIPLLRIALGIVFVWFGMLKLMGVSPVADIIQHAYHFMPYPEFLYFIGFFEVIIGIGLLFKLLLRLTLIFLWIQLLGTFFSLILEPSLFFIDSNPFLLTADGEFVVKNFILFASSLVIGGYRLKPLS